jgi:hypothetical protein
MVFYPGRIYSSDKTCFLAEVRIKYFWIIGKKNDGLWEQFLQNRVNFSQFQKMINLPEITCSLRIFAGTGIQSLLS